MKNSQQLGVTLDSNDLDMRLFEVRARLEMLSALALAKAAGDGTVTSAEAWSGIHRTLHECSEALELDFHKEATATVGLGAEVLQ
jgi:hypothetical protein